MNLNQYLNPSTCTLKERQVPRLTIAIPAGNGFDKYFRRSPPAASDPCGAGDVAPGVICGGGPGSG